MASQEMMIVSVKSEKNDIPSEYGNKSPENIGFKDKFNGELQKFYSAQSGQVKKPWTNDRVVEVISHIKTSKVAMNSGTRRTPEQYYWSTKYDLVTIANEECLILKKKKSDEPTIRVIPIEQYFELLFEIHKEIGHGGRDKMQYHIKNKFYVQKKAIEIFVSLCPVCDKKRNLPRKGVVTKPVISKDFNTRAQIDLIDLQSAPDGPFKWLLNYQDHDTKFIQLRPLQSKQESEVALELVKIFLIFGPPNILQIDDGREFTDNIIKEVVHIWPECTIANGSPRHPQTQGSVEISNQDVENMLRSWMRDNNSTKWSIGCNFVQYQKNSSYHRFIGKAPYSALFGCDPKSGLQCYNIPGNIPTSIETGEELEQICLTETDNDINNDQNQDLIETSEKDVVYDSPVQNTEIKTEVIDDNVVDSRFQESIVCVKTCNDDTVLNNQIQDPGNLTPTSDNDGAIIDEYINNPERSEVIKLNNCPSTNNVGKNIVVSAIDNKEASESANDLQNSDMEADDTLELNADEMFVRLFVDENLDRIVPISKQPKEKIQAIIDSCTRQFPEFAERARKRIRTYLKSCRRNKKVRGDIPTSGNGGSTPGSGSAWDSAVRPTPAHLTSVQAEHILAQACENESLNAKRMRLGLDPVSQPMPTVPTPMAIDTTATSAVASSFLSLYSGAMSSPASTAASSTTTSLASGLKAAADTTRPSASPTMDTALNNNTLKIDNANGNTGSKTASPASSPAPLFRPSFPNTFGTPQTFGRQNTTTNPATALSSSALLSTLTALPPTGVGVNAAMAAYQSALLSAMAAHTHTFPTSLSAPTDLSLKNTSTPTPLHVTTASSLTGTTSTQSKSQLLSHKLSGAEVGAVRQLITGYRESAAFLLRSADELEALLLNQP